MPGMFLDPRNPINTCTNDTCDGCKAAGGLVCHFNLQQLLAFLLMSAPVLAAAGLIIHRFAFSLLLPWLLFIPAYFGLIEIRVMCSHCPHYAEPGINTLKCWANYGAPKLWKYRPGPMSIREKSVFYAGLAVIAAPPIVLLGREGSWFYLVGYLLLLAAWKLALSAFYCKRCINFACPFNRAGGGMREEFFAKNPEVGRAWRGREMQDEIVFRA